MLTACNKVDLDMKSIVLNWKTTVIAVLTALMGLLTTIGIIDIPPEVRESIIVIAVFLIGLMAADARSKSKG